MGDQSKSGSKGVDQKVELTEAQLNLYKQQLSKLLFVSKTLNVDLHVASNIMLTVALDGKKK